MALLINLDAEREKRGKPRGLTQAETIIVRHDGYSINERAQRAAEALHRAVDCGEEMLRYADRLREIAEHGDYNG